VEKLIRHIEKLLAKHDYVVVPNLGGFIVQSKSAVLLTNSIIPPLHSIGFNPLMIHSDGLLALEIARTESVSYRAAMELLDAEVSKIKAQLQNSGNFSVGELGILALSKEGSILFTPIYKADFLPANFGLYDITVSKRESIQGNHRTELTFKLPSIRMYKYAAAAMVIFGLLFFAPELNDTHQIQTSDLSSILHSNTSKSVVNNYISASSENLNADSITIGEPANYHVIVSSLPSLASAERYCNELKTNKFTEAHVLSSEKTFRIAIQSFHDLDTAILHMEQLRLSDTQFETAWVYCE